MPGNVHIRLLVRCHRTATVQRARKGHHVALGLEGFAFLLPSTVKHWRAFVSGSLAAAIPGNMQTVTFSECDLWAANGPDRNGRSRLRIDPHRRRKLRSIGCPAHVEKTACLGIPFEVNQMDCAIHTDHGLWL